MLLADLLLIKSFIILLVSYICNFQITVTKICHYLDTKCLIRSQYKKQANHQSAAGDMVLNNSNSKIRWPQLFSLH